MVCGGNSATGTPEPGNRQSVDLQLTVVHYTGGPDRGTIAPSEVAEYERMTTWLSADRRAFEPLESNR